MNISVNLGASHFARIGEIVVHPLAEKEKVLVSFTSALYACGSLVVTAENGATTKEYKTLPGAEIDITELCCLPGAVDMSVSLVVKGEAVITWRVEPLLIKAIEQSFEPIPELEDMRNAIATMQSAIVEMNEKIERNNEM